MTNGIIVMFSIHHTIVVHFVLLRLQNGVVLGVILEAGEIVGYVPYDQ